MRISSLHGYRILSYLKKNKIDFLKNLSSVRIQFFPLCFVCFSNYKNKFWRFLSLTSVVSTN